MKNFFEKLIKETDFSTEETSWSPRYSSVGICAGRNISGAGALVFHYNRKSREVFGRVIAFELPLDEKKTDVVTLCWGENATLISADANCFIFESGCLDCVELFAERRKSTNEFRLDCTDGNCYFFRGFSETEEGRDPDREVPFGISLCIEEGEADFSENRFIVRAVKGRIRFSMKLAVLSVDKNSLIRSAVQALFYPCDAYREEELSFWREGVAASFGFDMTEAESDILAAALRTLIFNTVQGEGRLEKYLSCYPNRGTYPTHYLWDTYFQNLGYTLFSPDLAVEFLLQIAENIREDGKLPQFMCSTWARPEDSQGALLGWAVLNIIDNITEREDLLKLYDALCRNNRWWLTARITACGLIYSPSGLETGQDNSPRFDSGATIPCDMNAYLLSQLNATAIIAERLGDSAGKAYHEALAADFSAKMYKWLYCPEDGLFYDRDRRSFEFVRVRSNACVLPVWAGVTMPEEEKKKIIEGFLLDEKAMFGEIPFPSVSCDDASYEEDGWWRGPTWMPIARLLLQCLEDNGYSEQAVSASERLYEMMLRDGVLHELFNSKTGEGLGSAQQGWTAGIFIRMCAEKHKEEK